MVSKQKSEKTPEEKNIVLVKDTKEYQSKANKTKTVNKKDSKQKKKLKTKKKKDKKEKGSKMSKEDKKKKTKKSKHPAVEQEGPPKKKRSKHKRKHSEGKPEGTGPVTPKQKSKDKKMLKEGKFRPEEAVNANRSVPPAFMDKIEGQNDAGHTPKPRKHKKKSGKSAVAPPSNNISATPEMKSQEEQNHQKRVKKAYSKEAAIKKIKPRDEPSGQLEESGRTPAKSAEKSTPSSKPTAAVKPSPKAETTTSLSTVTEATSATTVVSVTSASTVTQATSGTTVTTKTSSATPSMTTTTATSVPSPAKTTTPPVVPPKNASSRKKTGAKAVPAVTPATGDLATARKTEKSPTAPIIKKEKQKEPSNKDLSPPVLPSFSGVSEGECAQSKTNKTTESEKIKKKSPSPRKSKEKENKKAKSPSAKKPMIMGSPAKKPSAMKLSEEVLDPYLATSPMKSRPILAPPPPECKSEKLQATQDDASKRSKEKVNRENDIEVPLKVDEILRLGAFMERVDPHNKERRDAFEWISLNRNQPKPDQRKMAMALHDAIGDVQVDKAMVNDALVALMYAKTIEPYELTELIKQVKIHKGPMTVTMTANLLRNKTKYYRSNKI